MIPSLPLIFFLCIMKSRTNFVCLLLNGYFISHFYNHSMAGITAQSLWLLRVSIKREKMQSVNKYIFLTKLSLHKAFVWISKSILNISKKKLPAKSLRKVETETIFLIGIHRCSLHSVFSLGPYNSVQYQIIPYMTSMNTPLNFRIWS